jgi:hypothetical protein
MKKAILTIAVVLFGLTATFAANGFGGPLKASKALKAKISQTIVYPEFALEQELNCTVYAKIKQETDGTISVVQCDSKVCCMRDYVREKLSQMNFEGESLEIGKEYTVRIDFVYID